MGRRPTSIDPRRVLPPTTAPSVVRRHLDDALGSDARAALVGVRHLAECDNQWLEERAVRAARTAGMSWAAIGRLLGRSRQAVRQRHVVIDGTPQPLPIMPIRDDQRIMRRWWSDQADRRRWDEFDDTGPFDVVAW